MPLPLLLASSAFLLPTVQPRQCAGIHAAAIFGPRSLHARLCTEPAADEDATYEACMRMRVSELKAELDLRKKSYEGVMEKDELARMLADARSQGLADPDIVDSFNKANLENAYNPQPAVDPDAVAEAVASDGGLPGGMSPETLMKLTQDPELMAMLRNPKMQDVMKKVMSSGPEAAAEMVADPDVAEMLEKFKAATGQ